MADLDFAIIGTGLIAEFHAAAIAGVPGARLAAVYARGREGRESFAKKHGCRAAESLANIVGDAGIRAVCITTPSGAHAEAAVPLLEAGKAVLCEKPLEVSLAAVDRILAAEELGRGVLAGVFQMRLGRGVRLLKAAIEAGRFGRLTLCSAYIKWWREPSYYTASNWKGTRALDGGGALMNQGIHAVDLLQWLAGMPVEVSAFSATLAHAGIEVEDTLAATLRYAHGGLGVIEASTSSYPGSDLRIEIMGDRGTAVLVNDRLVRWDFAEAQAGDADAVAGRDNVEIKGGTSAPGAISAEGHQQLVADLVAAIHEGRAPMIAGAEARRAVALVLAIYEACRTRRAVRVGE